MQANDLVKNMMEQADCVLFDGTLWLDDERSQAGLAKNWVLKWAICQ